VGGAVRFVVPGNPRGKAAIQGGFKSNRFPDKKSQAEIDTIRHIARLAMGEQPPFTGAVELKLAAYIAVPKSWSKKKRADALAGLIRPTVKPDADNIQKLMDGIQPPPAPKRRRGEAEETYQRRRDVWGRQKVILVDDCQITDWRGWKRYSDSPRLVVVITEIDL
jgi:Holliday junction resolvase RusA-like endonuclease